MQKSKGSSTPARNAVIGVGSGLRGHLYQVEFNMNNLADNPPNLLRERQKESVVPKLIGRGHPRSRGCLSAPAGEPWRNQGGRG